MAKAQRTPKAPKPILLTYIEALEASTAAIKAGNVQLAAYVWQRYPQEMLPLLNAPPDPRGNTILAENRLYQLHTAAVELLARTAECASIDPTPIVESARVCKRLVRDFGQWRDKCAESQFWPACIGGNVHRLADSERTWVLQSDAALRRLLAVATSQPPSSATDTDDVDQRLSPENMAKRYGLTRLQKDRLRKKLEAWRKPDNCTDWTEVQDRKPRQPQFLYRLGAVRNLIDDVKASP